MLNGNPEHKLPSPEQISLDVKATAEAAEAHVREEIKVQSAPRSIFPHD